VVVLIPQEKEGEFETKAAALGCSINPKNPVLAQKIA
jgi:hypothetical protein